MAVANIVRKGLSQGAPDHVKRRLMGTSADRERAPWETYTTADPLAGCSPEMQQEIAEYSAKHHGSTSKQNVEELIRQKEMSTEMVKEYKFYKQDELKDSPERVGRILHCLDWLKMFEKIRPAYLSANVRKGLSGLAVWTPKDVRQEDGSIKRVDWQYVCGVQVGFMHEYSSLHFDVRGLPLNEKWRGWRTVNLRLIQMGFMTEEQEKQIFGEATGIASRRHREQLFCWRNRNRDDGDHKDE
jgi:hypothetical protein